MPTHLTRRNFIATAAAATTAALAPKLHALTPEALVAQTDRARTLRLADHYLQLAPQTITAFKAPRSPGTPHDFYSEADYFWPNPDNPSGPYKEIDGRTHPDNFLDHRRAMLDMAMAVPALTAAWLLTSKQAYADHAVQHLRAWFVTPATRMTPNLEYAQAVRQGVTGRSWGIIDTLHLAEVARAATHLQHSRALSPTDIAAIHDWFRQYLLWLQTSKKGLAERDATNNHATAWALQAAEFARLIDDQPTRDSIQQRYRTILIQQMAADGSYPRELHRTKPYGYSIFNFDVMAGLTWSLGREQETRWTSSQAAPTSKLAAPQPATLAALQPATLATSQPATHEAGRGMCLAAQFLYPYLKDKSTWPYPPDIQHFESWPVRSPGLLFCGLACKRNDYIALWQTLPADPEDKEVNRNFPIRQPLLWM